MKVTTIGVRWSFIGFHRYPRAPEDVQYLASKHRHIFNVYVSIEVNPDLDRELEFHQVQTKLRNALSDMVDDQDTGSCETICAKLEALLIQYYPGRRYTITVDEDGECDSTLTTLIPNRLDLIL